MRYGKVLAPLTAAVLAAVPLGVLAASLPGDVNADGTADAADARVLSAYLLGRGIPADPAAADPNADGRLDARDLTLLKRTLLAAPAGRSIRVTDTETLKAALADAQPGDTIRIAPGEYVYSGSTPKGRMFHGAAEGTQQQPITLCAADPDDPPVLSGVSIEGSYVLTITGDWWVVRNLRITNASKGIILDHSNHTRLYGCEVYHIGMEGIHFRDDSSYCLAENCSVHDVGLTRPGYGEAVYVGSAKSTTDYGHQCDYNIIRGCLLGPNVGAEAVDIKEYTTGTIVEDCVFDGAGISGENYANSFVDIKGNDVILRRCTGYRSGSEHLESAFELNRMDEGWGRNAMIYGNRVYMDTARTPAGGKMLFLNSWDCTQTVWDNWMAYEGDLFSLDGLDDPWPYYNCSDLVFGDASLEAALP